jgi:GTP pyrophosphokinase
MQRKGLSLENLSDLAGLRIIVKQTFDCFRVLDMVHGLWNPLLEEFDDYISVPKRNGYQSLHTTVMSSDGIPWEVQIRTREMQARAMRGQAAHWRYSIDRDHSLLAKAEVLEGSRESIGTDWN